MAYDANEPDGPVTTTAIVVREDSTRLDAFLARVAGLSPDDWGRLDALGARRKGGDPLARVERARHEAWVMGKTPRELAVPARFLLDLVGDAVAIADGRYDEPTKRPRELPPNVVGEPRLLHERLVSLWEIAAAQPGGPGDAMWVLRPALVGLAMRGRVSPRAFERMWAPLEPFIPFATL